MERIWTAEELKKADAAAMETGLASPVLMERAALAVMDVIREAVTDRAADNPRIAAYTSRYAG